MGIMEKIKALFGGASSESEEPEAAEPAAEESTEESGDTSSNW